MMLLICSIRLFDELVAQRVFRRTTAASGRDKHVAGSRALLLFPMKTLGGGVGYIADSPSAKDMRIRLLLRKPKFLNYRFSIWDL